MTVWWLKFIGVAMATAVTHACWTRWAVCVSAGAPLEAALWDAAIVLCGSVSIFAFVSDWRFVPAAMVGAFAGTYLSVRPRGAT
jgi:hypothetical protein